MGDISLKHIFVVFVLLLFTCFANAQGGTWVWVRGSDTANPQVTYPVQGISDTLTNPPALAYAGSWTDLDGNFWIFGGRGGEFYSDLWKYNPTTNIWTWVKGTGATNQYSVYGTAGVPSDSSLPGARTACATWTDNNGDLWLFGGASFGFYTNLNDLWKYNIATNQWTWMKGFPTGTADTGVYGILQIPGKTNNPGARYGSVTWADNNNNLWLFGGAVAFSFDFPNLPYNDVWKYNVSTNEWAWMNGPQGAGGQYNYGIRGAGSLNNLPPGREGAAGWQDTSDNFYMFGGGLMSDQESEPFVYNDVWKYDPIINTWTWIAGDSAYDEAGNYQQYCNENAVVTPGAKAYSGASKKLCKNNNVWIFGGQYIDSLNMGTTWTGNDLWFFDTYNNKWNWISGYNLPNETGDYGNMGVTNPANLPSGRGAHCQWIDNQGTVWIFGGAQLNLYNSYLLNDLWKFIPDTTCTPISATAGVYYHASRTSICKGDTVLLNLTGDINPQVIPNTTITKLDSVHWLLYPDSTTVYTITGQSYCGNNGSQTFTLNVYTSPHLQVLAGDSIFCPGDSVMLAVPYGFLSYLWSDGDTNSYTYAKQAGNYYVTVTDNPACIGISDTVELHNYSILPVAVTKSGDTLFASGETAYEWFRNNSLISGFIAGREKYIANIPGTYTVIGIDSNGCFTSSLPVIISGIQEIEPERITIYPNPATNILTGIINSNTPKATGKIIAADGRVLINNITLQQGRFEIDVSTLAAGVYLLEVKSEGESWVRKFVKE